MAGVTERHSVDASLIVLVLLAPLVFAKNLSALVEASAQPWLSITEFDGKDHDGVR